MAQQRNGTTDEIIREAEEAGAGAIVSGSQPSLFDIAYLAGIIDGEGCILICGAMGRWRKSYQLRVAVAGTSLHLMLYLSKTFGARLCRNRRPNPLHKPGFSALWYSGKAKEIVRMVYPFLKIKRAQAEVALRWPNDKRRDPVLREMMMQEMLVLNKKGL